MASSASRFAAAVVSCCLAFGTGCGDGGSSPPAQEVIATTPVPSGFTATAGDGKITLTWQLVEGATAYNLYWASAPGVTKAGAARIPNVTPPYDHAPLSNGTAIYYVVTGVGPAGESAESEERSATPSANVSPCSAPAAPVASAVAGYSATGVPQFRVTWGPVATATTYDVYWGPQPDGLRASGTKVPSAVSPYVHASLAANTAYHYVVTATNACGESPVSAPVGGLTPGGLSQPGELDVVCTPHIGPSWTFDLSWDAVPFASSYRVAAVTDITTGNTQPVGSTAATTMAVTVNDCTTYTVAIPGAHTAYVKFAVGASACAPDVGCAVQGSLTFQDPVMARCAEKPAIVGWDKGTRTLRWTYAAGARSFWLDVPGCASVEILPATSCSGTECSAVIPASCAGSPSAVVTPFVCSGMPDGPPSDAYSLTW